jgi:hypothetical protein
LGGKQSGESAILSKHSGYNDRWTTESESVERLFEDGREASSEPGEAEDEDEELTEGGNEEGGEAEANDKESSSQA